MKRAPNTKDLHGEVAHLSNLWVMGSIDLPESCELLGVYAVHPKHFLAAVSQVLSHHACFSGWLKSQASYAESCSTSSAMMLLLGLTALTWWIGKTWPQNQQICRRNADSSDSDFRLVASIAWTISWWIKFRPPFERDFDVDDPLISHKHRSNQYVDGYLVLTGTLLTPNRRIGGNMNMMVAILVPLATVVIVGALRASAVDIHHGLLSLYSGRYWSFDKLRSEAS